MGIARLGCLECVVDLGALIARKRNGQAAEALRARLGGQPPTVGMRFEYADLLVRADRGREAIPILLGLADELLADGCVERSIGALRTVLSIDPQTDVKGRLAELSSQMQRRLLSDPPRPAGPARADFGSGRWSPRMRLRVAELVHGAGHDEEAAAILMSLADDLNGAGLPAAALSIMAGIERLHSAKPRFGAGGAGSPGVEDPARTREGPFDSWLCALRRAPWATEEPLFGVRS